MSKVITKNFTLIGAVLVVLATGTVGYMVIEKEWSFLDALYMTVITITTIGFGEIHPLSSAGRVFTIVLVFMGLGLAAGFIAQIGKVIVQSGLKDLYGKKRMKKRVSKLEGHYVICGYGRIGNALCLKLHAAEVDFVVVGIDEERLQEASDRGYPTVLGDAARDGALLAAGIDRAAGAVFCINDDATNVNIALAARELNPNIHIIARGSDPAVEYRLLRAGADSVVYPLKIGGEQIAQLIVGNLGRVVDSDVQPADVMGYNLRLFREFEHGHTVGEVLDKRGAIRAVAIRRRDGSMVHNPTPDMELQQYDSLVVLVREGGDSSRSEICKLEWTDDLRVGVSVIDEEHRKLFQFAQEFQDSVTQGCDMKGVSRLFDQLADYTATHFRNEEALMKEQGYPELADHLDAHRILVEQVMAMNRDKRYMFSGDIWHFLDDWLRNHIMLMDRAFAKYMDTKGAS